jgi:hypothetical protein
MQIKKVIIDGEIYKEYILLEVEKKSQHKLQGGGASDRIKE